MKTPEISGGWRHFKGNISFVSFGGGTHNPGSGRPLSSELLGPQGGGGRDREQDCCEHVPRSKDVGDRVTTCRAMGHGPCSKCAKHITLKVQEDDAVERRVN